jgi:hypothetical protein
MDRGWNLVFSYASPTKRLKLAVVIRYDARGNAVAVEYPDQAGARSCNGSKMSGGVIEVSGPASARR